MDFNTLGFSTPRALALATVTGAAALGIASGVFGTFSTTPLSGNTCTAGYGYSSGYGYGYGYECTPVVSGGGGGYGGSWYGTIPTVTGGWGGGGSAGSYPSTPVTPTSPTTPSTTPITPTPTSVPPSSSSNEVVTFNGNILTVNTSGVIRAVDISNSPYRESIELLIANGIVKNNVRFNPEKPITRAEFVKILANTYGFEKKSPAYKFADVDYKSDLSLYIDFGVEMGWINTKNKNFRPNDKITEGEANKLLDVILEKAIADTVAKPSDTISRGEAAEIIIDGLVVTQ